MVLESLISPFKAEAGPKRMMLYGFIYCSIAIALSWTIFKAYASLLAVFLTTMACVPLMYNTLKMEEEKDLTDLEEKALIKEHAKALRFFMYLFIGITLAVVLWYVVLPASTTSILFDTQQKTINAINSRVTGFATSQVSIFIKIFLNNIKVMVFCILFSFLYGAGAIFILTWNASVIGTAIGNFIRQNLAVAADKIGASQTAFYFQIITLGLFKYSIHGIPEILAYFTAGLAGGIISVAIIRHDFGTRKLEHILLDSADLILLSVFILFIAGILEVYVTPVLF
ncbi:MAG: stage II sporulation protein M [archaeon]